MTTNDFNLLKSFFSGYTSKEVSLEIDNAHSFTATILDEFPIISSVLLKRIFSKHLYLEKNGISFYVSTHPINGKLQIVFYDDDETK